MSLIQFGNWWRRNDHEHLRGFLITHSLCPEEIKELSKPDFFITDWKSGGTNVSEWIELSRIKTDYLKGTKLFAIGTLDWEGYIRSFD